jgi:hypothetical protein
MMLHLTKAAVMPCTADTGNALISITMDNHNGKNGQGHIVFLHLFKKLELN